MAEKELIEQLVASGINMVPQGTDGIFERRMLGTRWKEGDEKCKVLNIVALRKSFVETYDHFKCTAAKLSSSETIHFNVPALDKGNLVITNFMFETTSKPITANM